ncbi:MAG TPA: translation elongation factor Ts [Dehalococcoidia bacterium]|nr:translation elongation factor Ts [Dehalococcoidia bacterium]
MEVTLDMIKSLRERSGAGIMDCKRALEASDANEDKAMQFLLEQGIASAAKKAGRVASQGVVESYIHAGGRIGAIVEVNCETDFVARTPGFQALAREIAMQIAAMNPMVVSEEQLPEGVDGLPTQLVLLKQPYIRDSSKDIGQLIHETVAKTGENIQVRRFSRFELGE